jgi:biopolymer transport protein ExbD
MRKFDNVYGAETKKARIEIVPMIDAIFFLLVFFMYSSLSMVKMKGMGVSVPKLSNVPPAKQTHPPKRYIVTMDQDGKTFINLDPVPVEQLESNLTAFIASDPEGTIVVNVFKKRSVQELVDIMDQVNAVRTPKGEPAGVIVATNAVDAKSASTRQ